MTEANNWDKSYIVADLGVHLAGTVPGLSFGDPAHKVVKVVSQGRGNAFQVIFEDEVIEVTLNWLPKNDRS